MNAKAALSRPALTGIYTTEHSADTEFGLALELAFRIMDRDLVGFDEALVRLGDELSSYRFHAKEEEMEAYDSDHALDFDVLPGTRYNRPIGIDGGELKFPSATAAALYRQRWAVCPEDDVIEVIVGEEDDDGDAAFRRTLQGVADCLTVNNGYGRSEYGGYLKHRFDRSFAGLARLASFFADGREKADRIDHWHRRFVDVARIGYLAVAKGITFPEQTPYERNQGREGGFIPHLDAFRSEFPDIVESLAIGRGTLTRYECLFTFPGYLVALFAVGEGGRVREEYEAWSEAFRLGERVLERRKELVTELVVTLTPNETVFALDHVPAGVGLYIGTEEHIGKELWDFLKRSPDAKEWSPLQETFHAMLESYLYDDDEDGTVLTAKEKGNRAVMATLSLGRKDREKALLRFLEENVYDPTIRLSLQRLAVLYNCRPALLLIHNPDGHFVCLTNARLDVKIDLQNAQHNLNRMEEAVAEEKGVDAAYWHIEGQEVTGRFRNHMMMTRSAKVGDREPSNLTAPQVKKVLRLTVGTLG